MHACLIAEARGNQRHAFQLNATVAEHGFAGWIIYYIIYIYIYMAVSIFFCFPAFLEKVTTERILHIKVEAFW